jgi:putative ABC transport system permease protein
MNVPAAVRSLSRHRWSTATAVLTIALGIGANTAIFSVVNRVAFWPLPYEHPDQLVWLAGLHAERGQYSKTSGWDFAQWKQRTDIFQSVEAYWDRPYTFSATDRPEAVSGWQFTPTLFSTLGAHAALGRTFLPEEGEPGRDAVVLLSDDLWRRRFDADPSIVGRTVQMDGRDYTVVGVMPASFAHPYPDTQLWTPLTVTNALLDDRKQRSMRTIARLRDGITREQADAALAAMSQRQASEHPDTHQGWSVSVRPIRALYVGDASRLLWILQGTALILLLIAASNVASLVLVRASGRQEETAIRLALGASRMDLLRQHLAEGLALAGIGAVGGLLLAIWGTQVLPLLLATQLSSMSLPHTATAWLDFRVLALTAAVTLAAGVVFGLAPLARTSNALAAALRSSGRGSIGDRRTRVLRHAIVTGQIALSVFLLIGAGLLIRSFTHLQDRTFGYRTDGVTTAQLVLPRDRFATTAQTAQFLNQLVNGVAALPGVESAGAINTLPLTGFNALRPYNRPGRPPEDRFAEFRIVTPDYLRTMAIPLRRGRVFDDRDRIDAMAVVLINETMARRQWPDSDPIGQTLMVSDMMTPKPMTVVGVVGDTRHHDLAHEPEAEIYRPAYQAYWPFFGLVVRSQVAPETLERSIRAVGATIDRNVPLSAFKTMDTLASTTSAWRRSSMALLSLFACAAALLAFVGVYSVMAYTVSARSREIGVRLALGARPIDVARSVISQGVILTGVGTIVGLGMSAMLGGVLGTLLFGVTPLDLLTFTAVCALAIVAGLLATCVPAITAARVNPTSALRGE